MLESINGMIFQRHYPYHTVAPPPPHLRVVKPLSPRSLYSYVWLQGGAGVQNIYPVKT